MRSCKALILRCLHPARAMCWTARCNPGGSFSRETPSKDSACVSACVNERCRHHHLKGWRGIRDRAERHVGLIAESNKKRAQRTWLSSG